MCPDSLLILMASHYAEHNLATFYSRSSPLWEERPHEDVRGGSDKMPPTAPGGVSRLRRGDSTRGVGLRAGAVLPMGGYFCGTGLSHDVISTRWLWSAVPEAYRWVSSITVYNSVSVVYLSMSSPFAAASTSLDRRHQPRACAGTAPIHKYSISLKWYTPWKLS
jgi:hypothetical protein